MKLITKVAIVLFFTVYNHLAKAQESDLVVFYEARYIPDSTDRSTEGEDLMVLFRSPNYSVFQSYFGFQRDSLTKALSNTTSINSVSMTEALAKINTIRKPSYSHIIHKDFEKSQIDVFEKLFFDNYRYLQAMGIGDWQIQKEKKEIAGYMCQKASINYAGRNFVAYYTEDISINDGPYVFQGLPGLILEIYDEHNYFSYKAIGIEKRSEELNSMVLKNPIKLPKADFFKLKKAMYKDVSKAILDKPGNVSREDLQSVQARYDKSNNPLELNP